MSREMKDSGVEWIGLFPTSWKILRNKNLFTNEKALVGNESSKLQLLSLTTQGVKKKDINAVGGKQPESFDTYQYVQKNDLIMCLFDLDVSAVFSGISLFNGMISPAYKILKCKDNVNPYFYDYWFKYIFDGRKFSHYSKNLRYTLNYDEFGTLPVVYPSMEEQQRIANFLDEKVGEIDKVIAKTKDSIEEYHNLEKAIIQEAVTKGLDSNCSLVDSGVKYIGLIPENWDVKRVKYIASSILKGNGITKDEVIKNGNIQCIRYGEIYTKYKTKILETISRTNYEQISSPKQIEKGDILCAATGELVEEIGKNVVYMGDDKCLAGGDIIIVKHNQNPEYLNYALNSIGSQEQKSLGKTKLKVIHISASEIGDIKVALPNLIEQQEIVDYLNKKCKEIELLIENKSKIISDLEKYKKSLIYEYVTGKREVR